MSGETEKDVSGLTTDTLKLLMDSEFRRSDDRFAAFLETYQRDQQKANEFRSSLDDLGKTMATRRELEAAIGAITQRLDGLAVQGAELRSRLDIGPVGLSQLQLAQAQQSGMVSGRATGQAALYATIAAVGGVLGIIIVLANLLAK